MSRVFKNPSNGYTEEVSSLSMLWALLFGWFYYMARGLWAVLAIHLVCSVLWWGWMGGPGTILVMAQSVLFALMTPSMLAKKFLSAGWVEITGQGADVTAPSTGTVNSVSVADELLKLKALQEQGAITQQEFDEQKLKLLARS